MDDGTGVLERVSDPDELRAMFEVIEAGEAIRDALHVESMRAGGIAFCSGAYEVDRVVRMARAAGLEVNAMWVSGPGGLSFAVVGLRGGSA